MTGKLPAVKAKDLIRVAERVGFVLRRQRGSHAIFFRKKDGARVVIPVHAGKDIKPKTLAGILADMNLSKKRFQELL